MEGDDGTRIMDVEEFSGGGSGKEFSHQGLVMSCLGRCAFNGSKEMKPGYWNEKLDKFGNVIKTYIDDTRLTFIESVEQVEIMMICDFDDEATAEIEKLKKSIIEKETEYLKLEADDWNNCTKTIRDLRQGNGIFYNKNFLNKKLPYHNKFVMFQVRVWKDILRALIKLTQRKGFYETESGWN